MAFCTKCGAEIQDGAQFCTNCGTPVNPGAVTSAATSNEGGSLSIKVISETIKVLLKKPVKLWLLSILTVILGIVANFLGGPIPVIGIAVTLILELGMAKIYLAGYRGEEVLEKDLFCGFKHFVRSFTVMGWRTLVILLWTVVPIAIAALFDYYEFKEFFSDLLSYIVSALLNNLGYYGYGSSSFDRGFNGAHSLIALGILGVILFAGIVTGVVLGIIKQYTYSFVPYIALEDEQKNAFDVAKESAVQTNGYKGKMFLTDILVFIAVLIITGILSVLGRIPYAGVLFKIISGIVSFAIALLTPIFTGLIKAAWFEEASKRR